MIIGGGVSGTEAARMAAGLGANVTILDTNLDRLRELESIMPSNVTPIYSNSFTIEEEIKRSHLIIGTVLIPGSKAPKLIRREMLSKMMPGTVLVDVAIDQGGCFETSEPTTHDAPIKIQDGIIHYCVTNMPGAVPLTASLALNQATLPYIEKIADLGLSQALKEDLHLANGLNMANGIVKHDSVGAALDN